MEEYQKIDEVLIIAFQENLLGWFKKFGREFPWRETTNPYFVLIAEKLLQQTAVRDDLVQIYKILITRFPNPLALSKVENSELEAIISPLGLHYRSAEIIKMASELVEDHNGEVPSDLKALLSIHGIGDYSSRAVLCFAYGKAVPVVDTNIARILFRVFGIQGKLPSNPARKKYLRVMMETLLPEDNPKRFNWAMIDLGSLVCRATKPLCGACPLRNICLYYQAAADSK